MKIRLCKLSLRGKGNLLWPSLYLRPVMTIQKGVYHEENQKICLEFQHFFKANHFWPCTVTLRVSPHMPVSFLLHGGHANAVMCNYKSLYQQIHGKSTLQIICTCRWRSYSCLRENERNIIEYYKCYWIELLNN